MVMRPPRCLALTRSETMCCVTTAPDPTAEWWTTTDVATYLGVGVGTVSAYRGRAQMPPPDMTVGRTHMWRPATIIAWHAARPSVGRRANAE
jgi:hypothetical protein